ncbi:hypothetical protein HBB16_11875 [Pseudonocardia sp. MCCB 268]|nr:hypothetical protein [Pseudonocardia cytotoxica]
MLDREPEPRGHRGQPRRPGQGRRPAVGSRSSKCSRSALRHRHPTANGASSTAANVPRSGRRSTGSDAATVRHDGPDALDGATPVSA